MSLQEEGDWALRGWAEPVHRRRVWGTAPAHLLGVGPQRHSGQSPLPAQGGPVSARRDRRL